LDFRVLCQHIENAYAGLSPQLKRAARHALDHPDDIALLSMRQFAAKAEVHPSTMVRLAKVLGMDGYTAFQAPFQARLRTRPEEHYSHNARSIQARGSGSMDALLSEMLAMEHANLDSIANDVGFNVLCECAAQIKQARHIFVGGVRSCYPAAFYFQYACRMFENNATLLDARGATFADDLRAVSEDDVLIAISFSPYSSAIVRAVEYASARGRDSDRIDRQFCVAVAENGRCRTAGGAHILAIVFQFRGARHVCDAGPGAAVAGRRRRRRLERTVQKRNPTECVWSLLV